ncbi:MAG: glycosyltransferase [Candidatus Babeliales bacterium]
MGKILVFSVHAGGGHMAASEALKDHLSASHQVEVVSLFKDVLSIVDPIFFLSFGNYSIDDWYNFFVKRKYNSSINLISSLGILCSFFAKPLMYYVLLQYTKKVNPDLIISVIPIVNSTLSAVAKKLKKPFIIVPTDLDTRWFTLYFKLHKNMNAIFTLPFDDVLIWKRMKKPFNAKQIQIAGFPIKKSFFESKDIETIKKLYAIPEGKKILMLLMGGMGSDALVQYVRHSAQFKNPLHMIICLGKNESLRIALETIKLPPHISCSIIGFTHNIADLMAVSDLIITKSGSVSVCEALYMNLPMLLDGVGALLGWEKFNHTFITEHKFGAVVKEYAQVIPLLEHYLADDTYRLSVKKAIELYPKHNLGKEILLISDRLLNY